VHANFIRGLGTTLVLLAIAAVVTALTGADMLVNSPPVAVKPAGLSALEIAESRQLQELMNDINPRYSTEPQETEPPVDPNAPDPAGTYLYNNLLENLLNALHFYFTVPEDTPPVRFVVSWDVNTGERVLTDARLLSLEANVSHLLVLELYRSLHTKAIFDRDLEEARRRVEGIFAEDWHTVMEWPLGPYFDLVALWQITGNEKYLEWADRYGAGDGPGDRNTPLAKAKDLAIRFQNNLPRTANPFMFYHVALLAEWGSRNDPALLSPAKSLFQGLREFLYDGRYKMLAKQASVSADGRRNTIMTFDALEQLSAVRAIVEYWKVSGDPDAISLTKVLMGGIWGAGSPLLLPAPEPFPPTTFFGLYTAYDKDREAVRLDPDEKTIVQILLLESSILANEQTRGEFRGDIDFLSAWLEDNGPVYRRDANGYYTTYGDDWKDPERPMVSARAVLWMARALVEDEWYRFRTAQALTSGRPGT